MKHVAKMVFAVGALLPAMVFAQQDSSMKMMGKPGSLYAKYGIHKIAAAASWCVDEHSKDPTIMGNANVAAMTKSFPAPGIRFLVTTWLAHNLGGPEPIGIPGQADAGQVGKSFMFSKEEAMRFKEIIVMGFEKNGFDHMDAMKVGDWTLEWINKSKAPKEMPKMEMIKDSMSLYGRLGGIVPISMVVDEFVNQLAADPTIGSNPKTVKALTSGKVTAAGLKFLVTEQLAMAAGGPWKYTGRTMKDSHKDLGIGEQEWEAGAKILKNVLDMYKVPEKEQGEIFMVISSTKKDIVTKGGR